MNCGDGSSVSVLCLVVIVILVFVWHCACIMCMKFSNGTCAIHQLVLFISRCT